jgi:hypothetical protein
MCPEMKLLTWSRVRERAIVNSGRANQVRLIKSFTTKILSEVLICNFLYLSGTKYKI